jgi:hypothetical protein
MADSSDLQLAESAGDTVLRVHAVAGAAREGLRGVHGAALKIAVSAPPEKGKANERIRAVLATALGLPQRRIILVGGAASRDKRFRVQDIGAAELRALLLAALSEAPP